MEPEFVTLVALIAADLTAASVADEFAPQHFNAGVLWGNREIKLKTLGSMRVDVAPMDWDQAIDCRGSWGMICDYDIGVRKRFSQSEQDSGSGLPDDDEVVALITLLSDLLGWFLPKPGREAGRTFAGLTTAVWQAPPNGKVPVQIDWEGLRKDHQFTGHFPIRYEVTRDLA